MTDVQPGQQQPGQHRDAQHRDAQHRDRLARAVLTWIAEPGDAQLGALLRQRSPAAVVATLLTGTAAEVAPVIPGLDRAWARWAARLGDAPTGVTLEAWRQDGIRLVCPGDPEWPTQLDALGDERPWGLWVRGQVDLRFACLRSVSMVGTRAATAYGIHVTAELAAALAERGWTVVSGGAFGIDSQAHRGALAAEGITVAVLPSGLDIPYPRSHHDLFEAIAAQGTLVSEHPPGRTPTRPGFLVRNRLIAALSRGTVLVEAAQRSGALNTARHARDQNRPLMALPGPVTSLASAGCHQAIRDWGAVCVTSVHDVLACLTFNPGELADPSRGPVLPRDELNPVSLSVLEAVPARGGRGPARIAVSAGVDFDTVLRCLGGLAAAGFIERCERGWRIRRAAGPEQPP
ncbi:MAG TPA: DNA-processing protein DprA [Streptosporangiaceae bacterium]